LQFCCTERKKPEKRLHFITRALPQVARVIMSSYPKSLKTLKCRAGRGL
jgi:hypothetical protein